MFKGASIRLIHQEPDTIRALLARLRQRGCTAVAIIPHQYASLDPGTANFGPPPAAFRARRWIYPDVAQDPSHPFHNTPDDALVYFACAEAQAQGLAVLLKPHVDFYYGAWRGFVSVAGQAAAWTVAYQDMLAPYISIARELGTDLSLGCELYTVTKELGARWWADQAAWVRRQGFKNHLTYAANWGIAEDAEVARLAELWASAHIDSIGVDAYYPLFTDPLPPSVPTVAEVVAAWSRPTLAQPWCPAPDAHLLYLATVSGKPITFTEIGYPNARYGLDNPGWGATPEDVPEDGYQIALISGFKVRWDAERAARGYYLWEGSRLRDADPVSHNVLGRPAEFIAWEAGTTD